MIVLAINFGKTVISDIQKAIRQKRLFEAKIKHLIF